MNTLRSRNSYAADVLVSFVVFTCLLGFTYGILFATPYPGFYFNPSNGKILEIYGDEAASSELKVGDVIEKVGSITLREYRENRTVSFFHGVRPGDVITIDVQRDGKGISVPWIYPGFTKDEFVARFVNIWWLAYIFWIFGTITQIAMRPKDLRRRLLIAANHLTALFIIFGSLSSSHAWRSSALFHASAWLILPVYIQFHWVFPAPLRDTPRWAWTVFYTISIVLAIAEVFLLLPGPVYFLAVLLALSGSVILLFIHFFRRPAQRGAIRIVLIGAAFAVIPTIIVGILGTSGRVPEAAPVSLMVLPIMPATYFYAVYRDHLGGLEIRSNRTMSIYAFLVLLATALLTIVGVVGPLDLSPEMTILVFIAVALLIAWFTILVFPAFQTFVEKRILGITLSYKDLPEVYSARITTSATLAALLKLLEEEVFPSLLIRQYAFVRITNSTAKVVLSKNVTDEQVQEEKLTELIASFRTHNVLPLWEEGQALDWIQVILPLQLNSDLIGVWLLGRRDPDDLYPRAEVPILQSLADQTVIALSNILQAERLRKMYEQDIERTEKSRHQLALDLHDTVLNQLAILRLNVDEAHVSPKFQKAYDEVTSRLREIVTDLRPPMLSYGLQFAIEELADNLMERSKDTVKVIANVQIKEDARYPENIERHIFRIMQQACENSMRHGHASQINILAKLAPGNAWLLIEDNGIGFEADGRFDLDNLLASKHFGLAGMVERAMLIGANMAVNSYPRAGTRIQISWSDDHSEQADSVNDNSAEQ